MKIEKIQIQVNKIMEILEQNGFTKLIKASSTVTFYQINEQGIEPYQKWIRDYLSFVRTGAKVKEDRYYMVRYYSSFPFPT
jgi:hypothetical protein